MTASQHITIGDLRPRVQYVADGTLADFSYPFPIFDAADLEVYLGETLTASGFAVTGIGENGGGTVAFTAAPAAGTLVTLRRRLTVQRVTDFQEGGAFRAKVVNDELDYQTAVLQQLAVDISRCLRLSPTDPTQANLELPHVEPGKPIGWNADGTGLTNDPADFTAVQSAVAADAAAAEAAAQRADERAAIAESVTEPLLLSTVDAQEAAIMAQDSQTAAAASASAAAASETAAAGSAAEAAADATVSRTGGDDTMTSLWIAEVNRLAVSGMAAVAQAAETGARAAADAALVERLRTEAAAARAEAMVVVGSKPWQVLPNWAATGRA
ncbi:side tail fiber protein [Caenispirillum salinarum AK4]|uniref:Side tail fiber protein n=1 Tax=Caenispirillum salinarum AK4 TaxID=1238182 RepID=K9GPL8_9PROT|nr:phage tail fiber protein [Caenispirillum salinarum]EKV27062.1 side tail fiber protein [Caenispirillum salinarum AK4]